MTDTRTLAEKYNHAPGSFNALVDAFEIPDEPVLSMALRRVCREKHVGPRVFGSSPAPKSRGLHGYEWSARHLGMRAAYGLTDLSLENIAELFGATPATVRRWGTSWRPFEKSEGEIWWRFWGPANADLVGVPLAEEAA